MCVRRSHCRRRVAGSAKVCQAMGHTPCGVRVLREGCREARWGMKEGIAGWLGGTNRFGRRPVLHVEVWAVAAGAE